MSWVVSIVFHLLVGGTILYSGRGAFAPEGASPAQVGGSPLALKPATEVATAPSVQAPELPSQDDLVVAAQQLLKAWSRQKRSSPSSLQPLGALTFDRRHQLPLERWLVALSELHHTNRVDEGAYKQLVHQILQVRQYGHELLLHASLSPNWLDQLNQWRQGWFKYGLNKVGGAGSPLLNGFLSERRGNVLAASLFFVASYLESDLAKSLPPHHLGLRLYNNHVEPVLFFPQKSYDMNLLSGETQPSARVPARIYHWPIIFYAFLNHLSRDTVLTKADLVAFDPLKSPPASVNVAFDGSNLAFGSEPHAHRGKGGPFVYKPLELPLEKTKADVPPVAKGQPSETEKLPDQLNQAMKDIFGDQAGSEESRGTFLELAAKMAQAQGMESLAQELKGLDPELLAKLQTNKTSPDDEKKLEKLKEALKLLLLSQSKKDGTAEFVAAPVFRAATEIELKQELTGALPFLVKWPRAEQLRERWERSEENLKIRQFHFRIVHPKMDVVLRPEHIPVVKNLGGLKEKFSWLLRYGTRAVDQMLNSGSVATVPAVLLSRWSPGFPMQKLNLQDLAQTVEILDQMRKTVQFIDLAMTEVFYGAFPYSENKEETYAYFNYHKLKDFFHLLPLTSEAVAKNPGQFLRDLTALESEERQVFLTLHRELRLWLPIFAARHRLKSLLDSPRQSPDQERIWRQASIAVKKHWESVAPKKKYEVEPLELFRPFLPLVPLLVDPNQLGLISSTGPVGKEDAIWVDIKQGDPTVSMRGPIGRKGSAEGWSEADPDAPVAGPGIREKSKMEKLKIASAPTLTSTKVFLGLVLALDPDQLRHPLVQTALLRRWTPEMLELLKGEFRDRWAAMAVLDLFSVPEFLLLPIVEKNFPELQIRTSLQKEFGPANTSLLVEFQRSKEDDQIQAANRRQVVPSRALVFPEAVVKSLMTAVVEGLGAEVLRVTKISPLSSPTLESEEQRKRVDEWGANAPAGQLAEEARARIPLMSGWSGLLSDYFWSLRPGQGRHVAFELTKNCQVSADFRYLEQPQSPSNEAVGVFADFDESGRRGRKACSP